ncbi:MAG: ABC transporter ATP-binding protein [bacterium]|nr:ABC transporter ATP-binding protein [bacterium]
MFEICNLTCGYDGFLLKGINLKVSKEELLGIIGPNGSGKTTITRAMTKIIKPKEGKILFCGDDIEKLSFKKLAKKVAVATQVEISLNIKVLEFVLLGRIPHFSAWQFLEEKKDMELAERAMDMTNTSAFKERPMDTLSGGERQLAIIARALAQEPELLILDEPTAHLDISHQLYVLDLLRRLNKAGLTIIVVLHDLNLASEYCDRLVLLKDGAISKVGSPKEVLTYQAIEDVYGVLVVVKENPISSKPYIYLVSEEERQRWRKG